MLSFLSNLNPDFKKLLSGSGLVMAFKVAGAGAGYVFAYLITSNYGAETFGVFELSLTVLTIAAVFGSLGLGGVLVRFIPEFIAKKAPGHLRKVYGYALSLALPFSIFLAAPKKRFGLCRAFASTPPVNTFPDDGITVL